MSSFFKLLSINQKRYFDHLLKGSIQLKFILNNSFKSINSMTTKTFEGQSDRYNGVTIYSNSESCDINEFSIKLDESIKKWTEAKTKTIWFKIFLPQSDWVPILTKKGFKYHHAKENFVLMYLWLPKNEICNLPPYAHTLMGVGAVVINENQEILVVSEKYVNRPHWKLPGGYVEPGENLVDAVIREVLEETNIKTEFLSILSFRHTHNGNFGCSDIYTVYSLKPLTIEIKKCDKEIRSCIWMSINEYLNHPHIHKLNKFCVQKYLDCNKNGIKMDKFEGVHEIFNKPYTVYHICKHGEISTNL